MSTRYSPLFYVHLLIYVLAIVVALAIASFVTAQDIESSLAKGKNSIRVATYNVALNRRNEGDLLKELESGESESAAKVAAVIQIVRPDILLLNELDYDGGNTVRVFNKKYLGTAQHGQKPLQFPHVFVGEVNTGVEANVDFNGDGKTSLPDDAYGFGRFSGQYGMAVLSMHPIDSARARTFQKFLWKDMPRALLPVDPKTSQSWYSNKAIEVFRLSSKSHWDLPVNVGDREFHFLVCHPTPPVFDGDEDRNGRRNYDEIRLWADYVRGDCHWLYDDTGKQGGLKSGAPFVVAGDLNADPNDGDSTDNAIDQLLNHERIQSSPTPRSTGGAWYAKKEGKVNLKHAGDPAFDTGNFNDDSVGNVRIDYVLPSKEFKIRNQGVFWPKPKELGGEFVDASDHRLVWIDIELP